MKRILAIAMAAGLALSASAEMVEQWKFDDASTVNLNSMQNSGTAGTAFGWGDPTKWHTDDAGSLVLPGGPGNDWKATDPFAAGALAGSDTYSLEMKVSSWDNVAGSGNNQLKYRLRNAGTGIVEIQFNVNDAGATFTLISAGTNYRNHNVGGLTGSGATARVDFNLADGTAAYFVDGVAKETFSSQTFADMTDIGLSREGGWANATTSVSIDELSVSVIPEPATLGLMAFIGGAMIMIRRRLSM